MISVELWRARIGTFNNKCCSDCSLSSQSSLASFHCHRRHGYLCRQTHRDGGGSTDVSQEEPSSVALTSPSSNTLATKEQSQEFSSTDHHSESISSSTCAPQSRSQLTLCCSYGTSFSSTSTSKSSSSSSPLSRDLHRSLLRDAVITLLITIISQLLMIAGDIETNPGPKHGAGDTPDLHDLLCMTYTGEDGRDTRFRLMDQLQPYWMRLAAALKFQDSEITVMEHKDNPVLNLLRKWLRGANQERDSRPVTWATLITALRDANVQKEADILEKHFVEIPVVPVAMSQAEESQEPGKYFELIRHPSGGYIMRHGPIRVLVKPDVPEKLRSLLEEYASMLMILRRSKLSKTNFSDLKLYLSGYCSLESIEHCTSLRAVVDLLIKHLKVYMFNIYTLNISCKYFNDTIKLTVQKYKKCLNDFIISTSVEEFKSTIETQVVDRIGMESITLKLDESRVDDTLKALNTLLYHFFGNCSRALSQCEIGSGCVCITWLVSASLVSTLRAMIERHTQESLASRGVLELVIGLQIAPVEVRMENEVTSLKAKLEACRKMIRARDKEMSNRSSPAVQNEGLKIDLKAAQQEKSHYKEKCKELEVQMENACEKLEREMKVVQELQTKIAAYQKEVEAREQEISQLKKELNALENEICAFRDQNKGLDTVIKKLQTNLSDCEMECEKLKKELNAAQQLKAEFEEKAQKLGNKVGMFAKRADDKPGLYDLQYMSYTGEDGRESYFRLMDQLRPHWRRLAIALKFHQHDITVMEQKDDPVYYLLSAWLRGANQKRDSRPVTWGTLITALRDANVQEEAAILEKHFVEIKLPIVPVAMSQVETIESQVPGKFFELIPRSSGGYMWHGPIHCQVIVKSDVPNALLSLMEHYADMLLVLRSAEMPAKSFHKLKMFLSDFCEETMFRRCSNLCEVVDILVKKLKIYLFNINTLVACCEIFNDTIKDSVQEYTQRLNTFLSSTTVKEFKDTLQTQIVDCTYLESITLILDETFSDRTLRSLKQLVYHFFADARFLVITNIQKNASKKQKMKSDVKERGQLAGVDVIAERVFEVEGEKAQSLQWVEHGFSMYIPEHCLLPYETCAVVVKAIVGGKFHFPADTEPVSAIYSISFSKPLHCPARIQLQHCVVLNDPECLTFAVASHGQSTPYIFYEVPQGSFERNSFYGWIDCQQFSFVTTLRRWLWNRRVQHNNPVQYIALPFIERKEFEYNWILAVSKNLRTLKQNVIDHFKNAMEEDDKEFVYNEEEVLTVNVTDAPTDGWIIEPSAEPCIIKKEEVDSRDLACTCGSVRDRAYGPKCVRVRVATQYGNPPTTALRTTIQLDGITPQHRFNILLNPPPPQHVPHHQGEPQLVLDSAPTPSQFYKRVIKKIPSRWHTFGIMLDIEPATLDGINKPNPEECFTEVYKTWKANKYPPFIWRTVLTVLNDIDEIALKHEIELHLS